MALADRLSAASDAINRAAHADRPAGLFVAVPGATRGTAHADLMNEARFDAIIELRGERVNVDETIRAVVEVLPVDLGASAVLVGIEHEFVGGEDAYRLQVFIAASPALSHDAFIDHWLHRHGNLIRPTRTGPPYKQFHADPDASDALAASFDTGIRHLHGAAIAGYPDVETYRKALSNRQRMAPIIEDERLFIDHSRSMVGFYRAV